MNSFKVLLGDAGGVLKNLSKNEKGKYQLIVTSPPYYKHRKYGSKKNEIGQEISVESYLDSLINVFAHSKELLTDTGSLFIVIGDARRNHQKLMIPHKLALKLTGLGYFLQEDIIWHKRNAMSSGAGSTLTQAYEFVLFFSKTKKPYLDMDSIRSKGNASVSGTDAVPSKNKMQFKATKKNHIAIKKIMKILNNATPHTSLKNLPSTSEITRAFGYDPEKYCPTCYRKFKRHVTRKRLAGHKHYPVFGVCNPKGKNPGNVWSIATKAHHGQEHFAIFPEELVDKIIRFATREGDYVLDPFAGRGTAGIVSACLKRKFTGIDLYAKNISTSKRNIRDALDSNLTN